MARIRLGTSSQGQRWATRRAKNARIGRVFRGTSEHRRNFREKRDWLAVQPVCREPVSAGEFPNISENTGISSKNGPFESTARL